MLEARNRFAYNLRRCRKQAAMSQEELAAACDLHRTAISLLERSKRSPKLETLVALARGLDQPVAALLDGIF